MATDTSWEPFGIPDEEYDQAPARGGTRVLNLSLRRPAAGKERDRAAAWLRNAMIGLGALAAAAAVVSLRGAVPDGPRGQARHAMAALEAGIPDAAALVFASLGIAPGAAWQAGDRARVLNVGAVATSITMNLLAAGHGWRNLAIWVMPPVAYALASDTAIGVIRAYAIARQRELSEALAEDETTPLAIARRRCPVDSCGWSWPRRRRSAVSAAGSLRPARRSRSPRTASRRRRDRAACCPDAGQRGHHQPGSAEAAGPAGRRGRRAVSPRRRVSWRWSRSATASWPAIDPAKVSRICTDLAPEVGLNAGAARSALLPRVRAAQAGGAS